MKARLAMGTGASVLVTSKPGLPKVWLRLEAGRSFDIPVKVENDEQGEYDSRHRGFDDQHVITVVGRGTDSSSKWLCIGGAGVRHDEWGQVQQVPVAC